MEQVVGFVGRAREAQQALEAIARGKSVLVRGRAGIGKSSFLRHVMGQLESEAPVYWFANGSVKPALDELARQVHETLGISLPAASLGPRLTARAQRENGLPWSSLARTVARMPASQVAEAIVEALKKQRCIVFLESLEVPPTQAELFAELLEVAQVVAAMDESNRRTRIERLAWRFTETIELKPLALEHCEQIAEAWLTTHPVRFADESTRRRFLRHVAQDSGGVPAAIRGMLEAAEGEEEITPGMARGFTHEAGVRYIDMTPLVVLLLIGLMAMRYISRGASMEEMTMVAGVGMALFTGVRFLLGMLRGKR